MPSNIDAVQSLSIEVKEKIKTFNPKTIGELSRIPGITPAAVVAVLIYSKHKKD